MYSIPFVAPPGWTEIAVGRPPAERRVPDGRRGSSHGRERRDIAGEVFAPCPERAAKPHPLSNPYARMLGTDPFMTPLCYSELERNQPYVAFIGITPIAKG